MLKRKYKLIIFLLVIIFGSFFFLRRSALPVVGKPKEIRTVGVTIQDISEKLILSGSISAHEHVTLRFQTSGLLNWVGVKTGDVVKKHQAIASLDKRELKKNLDKQLIAYNKERWDFEQTQADYKQTKDQALVTDSIKRILEQSQFDLNNSVINVELQSLAIRLATITSPIDGLVVKIDSPYPGVNITPTQAEFEIVNPQTIYFLSDIGEEDINKIHIGEQGLVTLDSLPDKSLTAVISEIGYLPKSGESAVVYEVKFSFNHPEEIQSLARIGMNGDASIVLNESKSAITIPISALTEASGKTTVSTKDSSGKIVKKTVETGIENDDYVEIKSGLSPNDQVIIPN